MNGFLYGLFDIESNLPICIGLEELYKILSAYKELGAML